MNTHSFPDIACHLRAPLPFSELRRKLGRETYHVTALWPDGEITCVEAGPDRDDAFDQAAESFFKNGCAVEVMKVLRGPDGAPTQSIDLSAAFYEHIARDPEREIEGEVRYG